MRTNIVIDEKPTTAAQRATGMQTKRAVVEEGLRMLVRAGVTVRETIDVMIGTYCIEKKLPLPYSDRAFDPMVDHLGLKPA